MLLDLPDHFLDFNTAVAAVVVGVLQAAQVIMLLVLAEKLLT